MSQSNPSPHPEISIVIPFFDEAESLPLLVEEIRATLDSQQSPPYEIVLVDDASRDDGLDVARQIAASDGWVRIIRHRENQGQSAALLSGFEHARGEIVITMDADLQNDPADIRHLMQELDRHDVVCGIRVKREDSLGRRVSSRIANAARNWMTGDSISDVGCSLRAIRADYLRQLPRFNGMHRFLPTLLRLSGARVVQIEVNHRPRRFGTSKYGVGNRLWRGIVDLFGVRWLQARWIDPRSVEEKPGSRDDPQEGGG